MHEQVPEVEVAVHDGGRVGRRQALCLRQET